MRAIIPTPMIMGIVKGQKVLENRNPINPERRRENFRGDLMTAIMVVPTRGRKIQSPIERKPMKRLSVEPIITMRKILLIKFLITF